MGAKIRLGITANLGFLLLQCMGTSSLLGEDAPPAQAAVTAEVLQPADLVGLKVDLVLASDNQISGAEVIKVLAGEVPGSIRLVTIRDPATDQSRPLMASMIRSLKIEGRAIGYVLDPKSKRLIPDDPNIATAVRSDLTAEASAPKAAPDPPAKNEKTAPEKPKRGSEKAEKKKQKKEEEPEIALRPGVFAWPELSKEQQAEAVKEQKAHLLEIKEMFPEIRFTFVETDFFLFYSDLSPQDLRMYVPHLDAMYKKLLTFFDLKAGTNIWRGKAIIIIFNNSQAYLVYEKQKHNYVPPGDNAGLCHSLSNGDVITSMRTIPAGQKFLAATIVHETTHGFNRRYKTATILPSWVEEGVAEYMANLIVPGHRAYGEKLSIQGMQRAGTMGGDFFVEQIPSRHYGTALNLTKFMIASDPKKYKKFFICLKSGMSEDEALTETYGIRRDALIAEYGRALGIQNLQP